MPGLTADQIIKLLGLKPLLEEGGLFRQTYRSAEQIPAAALPPRYARPAASPPPSTTCSLTTLIPSPRCIG